VSGQILFSVIIPTCDRLPLLETAVRSVLCQTYDNLELIVVDDGSSDGTGDALSRISDRRLSCISQANKGASSARNRGLEMSKGGYIAFLDSDDRWKPEKLQRTCEYINKYPDTSIFHTEEVWYRGGKLLNQKQKHKKPSGRVYRKALPICCISLSTAVVKKEVFEAVGTFDETLEACEDYDFWLRATARFEAMLVPEYLTIKDGGRPDQLTQRVWGLDRFRIRALEKMLLSGTLGEDDREATYDELVKKCGIFALGCEKRGKLEEAAYYRALPENYRSPLPRG